MYMIKKCCFGAVALLIFMYWGLGQSFGQERECKAPSHKAWSALLQKHVSDKGHVAYGDFLKDSTALNGYLKTLSACPPSERWTKQERLAYWINAYNAFTVKLVLRHYPVKSIKDIGPRLAIPMLNSVWDAKFFAIGGERMSLNHIEHNILRKAFEEPRIHFAIVCASYSCPKLLNVAYSADDLEQQLQGQAVSFINDPKRNRIGKDELELSAIFSWFKGDFTKNGSLVDFIRKYSKTAFSEKPKVSHLDYDWSLNGN